jgi:hypothetical protein
LQTTRLLCQRIPHAHSRKPTPPQESMRRRRHAAGMPTPTPAWGGIRRRRPPLLGLRNFCDVLTPPSAALRMSSARLPHALSTPSACPQHAFRMPSARLPPSSARLQPARRQTPGMPPNAGAHRKPTGVCQSLHDYAICRNNMRAAVILWPAMIEREPINGMALACLN